MLRLRATCITLLLLAPSLFAQDVHTRIRETLIRDNWPDWALNLPSPLQNIFLGLGWWQWLALAALLILSMLIGQVARHITTASLRARYHVPGIEFSHGAKKGTR